MKRRILLVLLIVAIVIPVGIVLHDVCVYLKLEREKETATGTQDTTGFLADYDRKIFGKYRFNRGSSSGQDIYMETTDEAGNPSHEVLAGGGAIEKLMHDGNRYIAYHISERIFKDTDREDVQTVETGEQYYAILDTQTKQTERFADVETLSDAIRERKIRFGNWYYTAAQNSSEGTRTPLVGEYSFEYIDSVHGQNILRREIPVFYGDMDNIKTDGARFVSFRMRRVHERDKPWYDDPVTNSLLSAPSEKRIGIYRRGYLNWFYVYYDRYVLFDAENNTVREFEKERELNAVCKSESILLRPVEIRKN